MCGLIGWWSANQLCVQQEEAFKNYSALLSHRGPDGASSARISLNGDLLLGFQRLAIVSPDNGDQPVASPSGRWWIQLNGEIYNHNALRRKVEADDTIPTNGSDAAVVAALLDLRPEHRVLESLRGMFALVIVDTLTNRISLYRDRMGVKPLYWRKTQNGSYMWASELRALIDVEPIEPNPMALSHLLFSEYIPAPWTCYKQIQKIRPGHVLRISDGSHEIEQWWTPPLIHNGWEGDLVPWERSLKTALHSATQVRKPKNIPTGIMLSGGVDSALIAAHCTKERYPCLSVSIKAHGYDEIDQAKSTANILNLPFHPIELSSERFEEVCTEVFNHMDEPLADSSLVPSYLLMQEANKMGLKVLLSGDGADESFGGYPTYWGHLLSPILPTVAKISNRLTQWLPAKPTPFSTQFALERLKRGPHASWWKRHQLWMSAWQPEDLIHNDAIWGPSEFWATKAGSGICSALYLDQRLYLAEGVLTKIDRASMAFGVEVRSPFMDQHLVELAAQMPLQAKLLHKRKGILRKLLKEYLPKPIAQRSKKGFGSPVSQWLREHMKAQLATLPEILEEFILPETLQRILEEHSSQKKDHRRKIWSALVLAEWLKRHL